MNVEKKIIGLSLLFGLAASFIDSYLDYYFSNNASLLDAMFLNVPYNHLYIRSGILLTFISFGFILGKIIARQKQIELALQASEEKYRTLFESAGDAIFLLEIGGENSGKILAANEAAASMHGYTVAEILTLNIRDLDAPAVAKEVPARIHRLLNGEWLQEEIVHIRKDGTVFPVEISAGVFEASGHKYILAFDRDITERQRAAAALRFSEEKYRALFESAGDAIFIIEIEGESAGKILAANKAAAQMHGYTVDEILAMNIGQLDSPESAKGVQERVRRVRSGEWLHEELTHVKKDGTIFPVEISAGLFEAAGRKYALAFDRDITERYKVAAALRESENRYRTLFDNIKDAVFIHDLEGRMFEVNQIACERLGYTKEELLTLRVKDIDTPACAAGIADRLAILLRDGKIVFETAHRTKTGKVIPIECSTAFIEFASQPAVFTLARDITERKLLLETEVVRKSEVRLAEAQRLAHIGNWDWNIETNELFWSEEIYRIFGLTAAEFGANYDAFLSSVHPDDREVVEKSVNAALYENKNYDLDHRIVWPNGEIRIIHSQAEVTHNEIGRPIRMIGTAQDITERKKIEEALRESEAKLQEQKISLEQKNAALKEILEQIEIEKNKIKEDVIANVEKVLLPTLEKLKLHAGTIDDKYLNILQSNLGELTTGFGSKLSEHKIKLAPREIEICNLIKRGLTNKEIADLLHITLRTVESHRKSIRKKLGIASQDVNLAVYLQSL